VATQRGGHQAPEEEQRKQEEDREGVELGRTQVLLDLLVRLLLGDRAPADRHAGLVLERGADPLAGVLDVAVVRWRELDREVRGGPVA
jgi:hypothetical protein